MGSESVLDAYAGRAFGKWPGHRETAADLYLGRDYPLWGCRFEYVYRPQAGFQAGL